MLCEGKILSELGPSNFPDGRVTSIQELIGDILEILGVLLDDGNSLT